MSVLLFMPESGGNPLESVIMTTEDVAADSATVSRFEYKDGKPVRSLSTETGSVHLSDGPVESEDDDISSLEEEEEEEISPKVPTTIPSISRQRSRTDSTSSKPSLNMPVPDPKQPQLRLTTMGAIIGASPGGAKMVKAVTKAQERRIQKKQEKAQFQKSVDTSIVHLGFYV